MKVLVVEDNEQAVRDICFCLEVRYPDLICVTVDDPEKALDTIETEMPDLLMLDSSLPGVIPRDFIMRIRDFSDVPLIMLWEGGTEMDRAMCLEAGADEYVVKPFSPIELLARVKALLRRTHGFGSSTSRELSAGDLTINLNTREVLLAGRRVRLTPIEYHLLVELARNSGKVLTHGMILEKVWGYDNDYDYGAVKKYIYRLRSKIEMDAKNPQMLLNERGVGYKFIQPI
jgi:DNA-binding response OmpR family regulator